ncbi:MAG: hypothetical protein GY799_34485 [Desulfobulbaceae bacterium]|nr:hypothetical protein [Desulfobulbaceae bacterium]
MSLDSPFKIFQTDVAQGKKLIAWNGVCLHVPTAWEVRVSGQRHLVFENHFQPQLQIRWEKLANHTPRYLQKRLSKFASQMGSIIPEESFPVEFDQLQKKFGLVTGFQDEHGMVKGGICFCPDCHTLVLFQVLSTESAILKRISLCLATLSCHNHSGTLWRVQDFSLALPVSFILKDYTFGAGLTRLSFYSSDLFLQTCTLGPADTRLSQQPIVEIFIILTGIPDLDLVIGEDNNSCEGYRSPTIAKQISFRLRREKPFISAKIWHDTLSNRLLTVILSSNRPIPKATTNKICSQYEIVQKKNSL